jgi:enamine deaminase RidA (YjgF/YER057c/UK114 family)
MPNSIFRAMRSFPRRREASAGQHGIEARLWPLEALCSMDLYALLNPESATIELMHTPTLNEAAEYGSSFARGMKVDLPDKTMLFISGTASIDERGVTVHLGDTRKQMERMLLNIRELLARPRSNLRESDASRLVPETGRVSRTVRAGARRMGYQQVAQHVCRSRCLPPRTAVRNGSDRGHSETMRIAFSFSEAGRMGGASDQRIANSPASSHSWPPRETNRAGKKFMRGLPMKCPTNRLAGRL